MRKKNDKLILTVESTILCDDSDTELLLEKYSTYYNFLKRKLLNNIINNVIDKDYINSLARNYGSKYKIHARLFKSLLIDCQGGKVYSTSGERAKKVALFLLIHHHVVVTIVAGGNYGWLLLLYFI